MNDPLERYQAKRLGLTDWVARLRPCDRLMMGVWYGQPAGVIRTLGSAPALPRPLFVSMSYATGPFEYMKRPEVINLTGFYGPFERMAQAERDNVYYTPIQFTDGRKLVSEAEPPDYFIYRVAPMDEAGRFNFSLTASYEYSAIRWLKRHGARTRIVFEVNPNLPRVFGLPELGANEMGLDDVDEIVEDDAPLLEFPTAEPTPTERAIAANVAALVPDRATVQLGFGTIPMAIGRLLKDRRELGIHSEMFCEGHIDLIEAGAVTNAHKGLYDGRSVCTFALGPRRLHRWCERNPALAVLPVEEVNSVPVLARVRNLVSINSILTIDLTGQACAHCLGPRTYSGLGGAFEFAYGAQHSPGGRSVLCLPAMTRLKDGAEVSNVVVRHPPGTRVTVPEHCVDWVVTEYGAARLKLLPLEQRAEALIRLAHPNLRDALAREARGHGLRLDHLDRLPPPAEGFIRAG